MVHGEGEIVVNVGASKSDLKEFPRILMKYVFHLNEFSLL